MQLPTFLIVFKKNFGKLKDFISSVLAGLLSGTAIGIFFNLTTDITFNRWINLFSYEAFAAFIYVLFLLLLSLLFYGFGILLISVLWKDKRRTFGFYINYIAGTYSSTITFLVLLYYDNSWVRNTIALVGVFLLFVLAYFTVKKKWPK